MPPDTPPASRQDLRQAKRAVGEAMYLAKEQKWVRLRLVGWALIGLWQLLGLLSEFLPIDLEARAMRITGRVLGLLGLLLVVYGFERLIHLAHERAQARAGG